MGRRVLVTGADTFWGGRTIQVLERDPEIDVIVGLGTQDPSVHLERAEFVRADQAYAILSRITRATAVDTIVHTFLLVDSSLAPAKRIHETNVIGTMNLLAAAEASGTVRQVIVKSSGLVYGSSAQDPATFDEGTARSRAAKTDVERSLIEAEGLVADFADEHPHAVVTVLRFANVLGDDVVTSISRNLSRPLTPAIFGFDPMLQFVHEHDVVRAMEFAFRSRAGGIFNVGGAGRLPWSEVAAICGSRLLPLPPLRPELAIAPLVRAGIFAFPPELAPLLRYGRGMDTTRFSDTGFTYRYTSAGAVAAFARHLRLRRSPGPAGERYTCEHDVEEFFRRSHAVTRPPGL